MKIGILIILLFQVFAGYLAFAQNLRTNSFGKNIHDGIYRLQQGTSGCASEVIWKSLESCQGFQLSSSTNGKILDPKKRELFCHINKGVGTEVRHTNQDTKWRIRYNVIAEENMIRKNQLIERNIHGDLYNIELEASIILDRGGAFMFDRSLGAEGTSCLYKK